MHNIQTRRADFLIASFLLLAGAGCGDSSGPGEPENPGVLLVTLAEGGDRLTWTSDGTELVYSVSNALNAVSVATHAVRRLDTSPSIDILSFCGAGKRVYFGASLAASGANDPNYRIGRLDPVAGTAEILTTTRWNGSNYLVVSADERFLVSNQHLYDLQAGLQFALPLGTPFGFSPDGTQLLYYKFQDGLIIGSPSVIATADGSLSQLQHSPAGPLYYTHRWEGNSPQLLDSSRDNDGLRLFEVDGITGVTRDLARFGSNAGFPSIFPVANWSPDGRTLGVWVDQGSGAGRRTNLYVIRAGTDPLVVASMTANFRTSPGKPAFSPSGNSVAYIYYLDGGNRSLYVKSGI